MVYYHYDDKGQLVRADENRKFDITSTVSGETDTFEYDSRGNITLQNYYAYTTNETLSGKVDEDAYTYTYDEKTFCASKNMSSFIKSLENGEFDKENIVLTDEVETFPSFLKATEFLEIWTEYPEEYINDSVL